jgi:quinolinate synthase
VAPAAGSTDKQDALPQGVARVVEEFAACPDAKAKAQHLLQYAQQLPPYPVELKTNAHRVMGCAAQAWVAAELDGDGHVVLRAASDSQLTAGLAGVLVAALAGLTPQQVLELRLETFLPRLGLGPAVLTPSRSNGLANMFAAVQRRTRQLVSALPRFPSLLIRADGVAAQGVFAEAQAAYLQPQQQQVAALAALLQRKRIGVVAHFYMDPQVCMAAVVCALLQQRRTAAGRTCMVHAGASLSVLAHTLGAPRCHHACRCKAC